MKVLVWATTFGADLWSFARYLDQREDVELQIVMKHPEVFQREPVAKLFPLEAPIVERSSLVQARGVSGFDPDVTVFDNEVPAPGKSKKGFALWHGFGWKGPNDRREMRPLHWQIKLAWGDPRKPNPNFRWQSFGPWDFKHRTEVSGIHPKNCRILGAASHDDLRTPVDRSRLNDYYPFDLTRAPTVLIAPTWHYGELFAHWGGDRQVLEALLQLLDRRGANVILRLHDSFRFEPRYLSYLKELEARSPRLLLEFKDQHPDNFLDLQVADVLLTNFSSIANLFYATLRPTLHIYPVKSADEAFYWRRRTFLGVFKQRIDKARYIWKLPPEDNGGLLAHSAKEMLAETERALDDPECCKTRSQEFLDRHMLGADGKNQERIYAALDELVEG